jgi:hypothetical protein
MPWEWQNNRNTDKNTLSNRHFCLFNHATKEKNLQKNLRHRFFRWGHSTITPQYGHRFRGTMAANPD